MGIRELLIIAIIMLVIWGVVRLIRRPQRLLDGMVARQEVRDNALLEIHGITRGDTHKIIKRKEVAVLLRLTGKQTAEVLADLKRLRLVRYVVFGSLVITDVGIAMAERLSAKQGQGLSPNTSDSSQQYAKVPSQGAHQTIRMKAADPSRTPGANS
jgi:hypothetical protein